ncbi:MAG: DegV family protein [Firmicutes bacterium]|nr:DegV family protein [Bacillota bacterium]
MRTFQIFSDGASDIPLETAQKNNIGIIPFYVSIGNEKYQKELFELTLNEYYDAFINKNMFPKTSLPSVQDYIDAFTPALESGADVLCFTITNTLSGSVQSAHAAREILEEKYKDSKIYVLNSMLATGAQDLLVSEAVRMRDNGLDAREAYNFCLRLIPTGRIMFMVGGLSHLQKGGRIGKLVSLSGGILKIKPLIELKNGEINIAGVSRSRKNGIKKLAEITLDYFNKNTQNPEDYSFKIGYTNTPEEVPIFENEIKSILPNAKFENCFLIGATISSHTGPGTLGVCFIKKYDKL